MQHYIVASEGSKLLGSNAIGGISPAPKPVPIATCHAVTPGDTRTLCGDFDVAALVLFPAIDFLEGSAGPRCRECVRLARA